MDDLILSFTDASGEQVALPALDLAAARELRRLRALLGGRDFRLNHRESGAEVGFADE